jgi:alanine dehydrogenase
MLSLSEQQVRELAPASDVIHAIGHAFARDFSATLRMPVRTSLPLEDGGVLLLMPAFDSAMGYAGVKLVTVTRAGGVNAAYDLLNANTGEILARMEANWLTDLRTAATSALATDLLARHDVQTLGIFGSGRQATAHFAVLPHVRRFSRFLVCGSGHADLRAFCSRMKQDYRIDVEPADAATCAGESDVICTCTTSPLPVFEGCMLRPGAHLNLVGAFQPETREVDDEAVRRSRIVVDTYDGALSEVGDLLVPLQKGVISREQVIGDLHEIASGKKPGRSSAADITLFKSVGCALEDLVTATLIYQRATA